MRHYELASQGQHSEAAAEVQALENEAKQQMANALRDLDGAIKYICEGENEHPNRIDICKAPGQVLNQLQSRRNEASQSAFGQTSNTPALGAPSSGPTFGQASSTPAFGQPSTPSTFGQPSNSAFVQPPNPPAFGQPSEPSVFGRPSTSTFGQPSAPTSAFGQAVRPTPDRFSTGTFGQPSVPAPAFRQTSTPAFGQTATFGRPTTSFGQNTSTFGQPSTQTPVFGQPSSQPNAFANHAHQASTFGQPSSQAPAFGQPSAPPSFAGVQQPNRFGSSSSGSFGQNVEQPKPSAFAAPTPSPLGQPATTTTMDAPSSQTSAAPSNAFGAATSTSSGVVFGRRSSTSQTPFTQPQFQPNQGPPIAASTPQNGATPAVAAAARRPSVHLPNNNVATRDTQGNLKAWKGKEVRLIDDNWFYRETGRSEWQRIWFPNGPPTFTKTEEIPESAYDAATKEQYLFAMKNESFGNGGIPLTPPRKEWCSWNI